MLKTILTVVFVLICVALTVIVLLQEGKSSGLGSISGMADQLLGQEQGTFHGRHSGEIYQVRGGGGSGAGPGAEHHLVTIQQSRHSWQQGCFCHCGRNRRR